MNNKTKSNEKSAFPRADHSDPGMVCLEFEPFSDAIWDISSLWGAGNLDGLSKHAQKLRTNGQPMGVDVLMGLSRIKSDESTFEELVGEAEFESSDMFPTWSKFHSEKFAILSPQTIAPESGDAKSIEGLIEQLSSEKSTTVDLAKVSSIDAPMLMKLSNKIQDRLLTQQAIKIINGHKVFIETFKRLVVASSIEPKSLWDYCFLYLQMNSKKTDFERVKAEYIKLGGMAPEWSDLSVLAMSKDPAYGIHDVLVPDRLALLTPAYVKKFLNSDASEKCKKSKKCTLDFIRTHEATLDQAIALHDTVHLFKELGIAVSFVNVNEILMIMLKSAGLKALVPSMQTPCETN